MTFPVYMRANYESRYSLLGAMADELGAAFASEGCPVNPDEPIGTRPGAYVWFNFPNAIEAIPAEARDPASGIALIQIFVDHPYAVHEAAHRRPRQTPPIPIADALCGRAAPDARPMAGPEGRLHGARDRPRIVV